MHAKYLGNGSGATCTTCGGARWIWRITIPVSNDRPALVVHLCDEDRRKLKGAITDPRPDHEREVRELLKQIVDEGRGTEWEDGFIGSVTSQPSVFSDKQMATAVKIIKKYLGITI